jgi:hypothetical protein
MLNKENFVFKPFFVSFIIIQLTTIQFAFSLGESEKTADYKEKIMNTSKALGISVYEDFPVYLEQSTENDLNSNLVLEAS